MSKERAMFTATGVDGCPAGWFFVSLPPHGPAQWGVVPDLGELVRCADKTDRIFVDIPIGLPDGPEERACDLEARRRLRQPRGSSVFPTPARAVLDASDYEDAKRRSRAATGKKISQQAFAILPRIRKVDTLMRRTAKARYLVREVHPEVCFWALNGHKAMERPKKKKEGFCERMMVLKRLRPSAEKEIAAILDCFKRKDVARDDALDAMAAAVTAAQKEAALRTLPSCPQKDSLGLPMEMVYADIGS